MYIMYIRLCCLFNIQCSSIAVLASINNITEEIPNNIFILDFLFTFLDYMAD